MHNDRQMFSGDWNCCDCGAEIKELPFEPRDTENLRCFDCHKKNRPQRNERRERRMFSGNWTCAECGGPITELPFEPRDDSNLKCRDCFRR